MATSVPSTQKPREQGQAQGGWVWALMNMLVLSWPYSADSLGYSHTKHFSLLQNPFAPFHRRGFALAIPCVWNVFPFSSLPRNCSSTL